MPIPNSESAFVPPEKLSEYLLNAEHPVGGPKARWFMSLGYSSESPETLEHDLLEIARSDGMVVDESTRFGVKYKIEETVVAPNGRRVGILTVWIQDEAGSSP